MLGDNSKGISWCGPKGGGKYHQGREATEKNGPRTVPVRSGYEAVGRQNVIPRPEAGVQAANRDGSRSGGAAKMRPVTRLLQDHAGYAAQPA